MSSLPLPPLSIALAELLVAVRPTNLPRRMWHIRHLADVHTQQAGKAIRRRNEALAVKYSVSAAHYWRLVAASVGIEL